MAIAGALIAAPAAHAATRVTARAAAVAEQTYTAKLPARAATVPARATATGERAVTDALVVHHEPARRYTVKPGDNLAAIAQETGVPLEELMSLNPELDPQGLVSGQRVRLRESGG